jgi:hypothetical protein
MQPLKCRRIEDFLISCYQMFPEHISISHSEYAQACKDYLTDTLNEKWPWAVLDSTQWILSNPMNLTIVALLGAYGKKPVLFHLQEQYYQMMAEEYTRVHYGQPFPLDQFSEWAYQM